MGILGKSPKRIGSRRGPPIRRWMLGCRIRLSIACALITLCCGCSLSSAKTYDGPDLERSDVAILSSVGFYKERKLSLVVWKIDGKSQDNSRTAEFLLLPGAHQVLVDARNDLICGASGPGLGCSWKEATIEVNLIAEKGHSYIPNAHIEDGLVRIFFVDAGLDFPRDCLPLVRSVNGEYGPAGLTSLYSTGGTCKAQ